MVSAGVPARPPDGAAAAPAVAMFGSFRYGQYYEDLLAGVVAAADAAGVGVLAFQASTGVLPSGFMEAGQAAVSRAGWDHFRSAIVVLGAVSLDFVADLRAAGKFVVAIGQSRRGANTAVTLDNAGGVRDAVVHLAEHGHTDIGFVSPTWQADAVERYAAYRATMSDLGLVPGPRLAADLSAELSLEEQGHRAADQFVSDGRTFTACLVCPDLIALGFVRGLRERGFHIPADVAVIGIDDVDEAAVSVPPLATVAISFERVGEMALNVALRGGAGEDTQAHYPIPQRLVLRESCGCGSSGSVPDSAAHPSPIEAFAIAVTEAAQESALESAVDAARVRTVTDQVVALLAPDGRAPGPPTPVAVASQINSMCTLDRSVQSVLVAVRALADALIANDPVTGGHVTRAATGAISVATLDLCDAIRSGQLQRRMAEYVDLKRLLVNQNFIATNLLGSDRGDLRSLAWLHQTQAQAGALGLWQPPGQTSLMSVQGVYDREATQGATQAGADTVVTVESFPPSWLLRDRAGAGRLVVLTQVRLENSDWGVLAVAGGRTLQSVAVQGTLQQWSVLMSASLDQEKANADLARQASELTAAYETEMALLDEVRLSEQRYSLAAEAAHDALWDWDIATGTVFYSGNWKALLGHHENEIGTTPQEWLERIHPDDSPVVTQQLDQTLAGDQQFVEFEHRLRVSTGEYRWMSCSARSVLDEAGKPIRLVGSINDVTVRRLLQEQLTQEALFDGLTGLAKSTLFKDRVNQAIELSRRRSDYSFAVLFVDLNGFKAVNDSLGHAAGDALLAGVADRLTQSLRRNDTAARLGGDEFAILLNDLAEIGELSPIVSRIEALIRKPHQLGGHTVTVGAAIGVCVSGEGHADADAMLHDADTAMYRAKRAGRLRSRSR